MRPVLENGLVDALRLVQMLAPVLGNARVENVVVAPLDHVDGVDLHVAEVLHGRGRRLGAAAERRRCIQPLSAQPEASGL